MPSARTRRSPIALRASASGRNLADRRVDALREIPQPLTPATVRGRDLAACGEELEHLRDVAVPVQPDDCHGTTLVSGMSRERSGRSD
jgi:hypothetical protein